MPKHAMTAFTIDHSGRRTTPAREQRPHRAGCPAPGMDEEDGRRSAGDPQGQGVVSAGDDPVSRAGPVHLEPHRCARPRRARRHAPPARKPVHDAQPATALRLNVQPILKTRRATSVVGDLHAQPIRTRPHPDGHRARTVNHRIGHQFAGQQLGVVNLRARPRRQQCVQPVSNSTHRGGLTRQRPDLHADRAVIGATSHHPGKGSEVIADDVGKRHAPAPEPAGGRPSRLSGSEAQAPQAPEEQGAGHEESCK